MGTIGSLGISPSILSLLSIPSLPIITKTAQSDGLLCVTISYYEHSDIIIKNIGAHRNSSEPIVTHQNSRTAQTAQPAHTAQPCTSCTACTTLHKLHAPVRVCSCAVVQLFSLSLAL